MKQKLLQFLRQIYGMDELNFTIMVISIILMLVNSLVVSFYPNAMLSWGLNFLNWVCFIIFMWRFFSKQTFKRSSANQVFLDKTLPLRAQVKNIKLNLKDRKHKYFVCKECHKNVRVPKHKGEIIITCPNCKNRFEKRT